jgi:hypothetical protein
VKQGKQRATSQMKCPHNPRESQPKLGNAPRDALHEARGAQQSEELTPRGEGPQNTCLRQRTRTDRHVQPKANPILRGDEQRKGGSRVGRVGSRADGSRGGKGDDAAISFPISLICQRGERESGFLSTGESP